MRTMKFLITGGAGYIGSITNRLLNDQGHKTVILDNFSTGFREAIGETKLYTGDLRDLPFVTNVFQSESFDAVIHFAASTLAGESMKRPYEYFSNNISGSLNLLEAMRLSSCRNIIFSSTCAVYGYPSQLPVTEATAIAPLSVYGASKRMVEQLLDWYEQVYGIRHVILRYFNACGAWPDGSLGESHEPETHIIPIALQVALGKRQAFEVFGTDYPTRDGTCIRDYIHVVDLADAHVLAAKFLSSKTVSSVFNLGIGHGYSNLDVITAVEQVTGKTIPRVLQKRRPGDPSEIYANNGKAVQELGWQPRFTSMEEIIETAWNWHRSHPDGFVGNT